MLAALGYKTKKQLKEAVGSELLYTETSLFGLEFKKDGMNTVVGPSATNRKWYATVECNNGIIIKVS